MQATHDPYGALRFRDYRRLLTGNVIAAGGAQMQSAAVYYELYQRTDSAGALGYVGLVLFLPILFLTLPAGQVVDHHSRKWVLIGAQCLLFVTALTLAALSYMQGPVWMIYLCLLLVGVGRAFGAPARWALVPQVVPLPLISNAVTWNSTGWQLSSVAGPSLAGFVIYLQKEYLGDTKQAWLAYLVTAVCSLVCIALVTTITPRQEARPPIDRSLHSLLAGVRFVFSTKLILATITLDLFAVLFGGATALLPVFARDILHVDERGYGWLVAAPSLGALVMALALAHLPPFPHAGKALLWAVAGFGAATIVFGLSQSFLLSFITLAVTGALDNISVVIRGTLVQVLAPDAMRGRISAVNSVFIGSSNELGAFESGITAQYFGPVVSVVAGGSATIVVVLLAMLRWPELLRLGPLHTAGIGPTHSNEAGREEVDAVKKADEPA
jgi:MFS family permease